MLPSHLKELQGVWSNRRSWRVAKVVAFYIAGLAEERHVREKEAFITWVHESKLEDWERDPIGRIKGVGINKYQLGHGLQAHRPLLGC